MISLTQVSKSYGPQVVLKDLSLRIPAAQITAITGPSGSGKSTLLNLIAGLDRADTGQVFFDGKDLSKLSNDELAALRLKHIGIIFQFFNLLPTLTVLQNATLPGRLLGKTGADVEERGTALLADLGILPLRDKLPHQLSGGEIQRCAIARALINEPSVILADEPTGNLDRQNGELVFKQLLDISSRQKITVVFVSHDEHLAAQASSIIHLTDGRVS